MTTLYQYLIKSTYCSDPLLVLKAELGRNSDDRNDIYNVNAIVVKDEDNIDHIQLRTRYYFTSLANREYYLYFYFESRVYIEPNLNSFSDKKFIRKILEEHDRLATECIDDTKFRSDEFDGFNSDITIKLLDYDHHSTILHNWWTGQD